MQTAERLKIISNFTPSTGDYKDQVSQALDGIRRKSQELEKLLDFLPHKISISLQPFINPIELENKAKAFQDIIKKLIK